MGRASVSSVTLDNVKGRISPVVVQGREPESADEVALGARTLHDAGTRLGGTVPISISVVRQLRVPKRVVGVVVLPPETDAARFGVGAILTSEGEHTLVPPGIRAPPSGEAVLRFAPGVDRTRLLADLHRLLGPAMGN